MNLTDEEIRIKVAEAMGWKPPFNQREWLYNYGPEGEDVYGKIVGTAPCGDREQLPNYPLDLNACASFEATLTDKELSLYGHELGRQTECMQWYNGYISAFGITVIARATARQRCLAYLKTKGLIP